MQFDRSFGPSDTRITIRGLSNTRGRSNVAFLVDNIDVTTENLIVAGSGLLANRRLLTDVERIEIVKGPQSALYGRAAFAGAINYITKEPGDVFEGTTRVDFAQDGFQQVDGAVGGPVSDTLGMRLTGFWYNQDGHYVNQMSGDDVGGSGGSGAALSAVWKPDDITKVKVRGEYSREDYDPLANVRIGGGWQDARACGCSSIRKPSSRTPAIASRASCRSTRSVPPPARTARACSTSTSTARTISRTRRRVPACACRRPTAARTAGWSSTARTR